MSSPLERSIKIEVSLPSYHAQLLQGLDIWLQLGLISDAQVRQLCQEFLSCRVVWERSIEPQLEKATIISDSGKDKPLPELAKPNFVAEILQSLRSELSLRWLLFLGVFLVVLSSGVLAASQWDRFSAAGQYGILFAYTISFWGLSFWTSKQSNLRLTAQTLLMVGLLLVPINFWAIDSFRLWYDGGLNWIVAAIASFSLTAITIATIKSRLLTADAPVNNILALNILGLNYLHWGWKIPHFPLIAIYLAVGGTTFVVVSQTRLLRETNLLTLVVIYTLLGLFIRGIFIVRTDITQLGLAIGICGWLVTWLTLSRVKTVDALFPSSRRDTQQARENSSISRSFVPWQLLGCILLFFGWLVSVATYPWQAIGVSGLSLWFFSTRLQHYNLKVDFAAIFFIGLQTVWLGWCLVPSKLQQWIIATAIELTHAQNQSWVLATVALFPYTLLIVKITQKLGRVGKEELARFGEQLTCGFIFVLTAIALVNPLLRSLCLFFSTATLATITQHRLLKTAGKQGESFSVLIYLTHITGILTFCSLVDWLFPNLPRPYWATILLIATLTEWLFSIGDSLWKRSAWHIGFGLATVSFLLLWRNEGHNNNWGLIWLSVPLTLTAIASRFSCREKRTTSSKYSTRSHATRVYSVLALGLAQILTLPLPQTRLISLTVAAAVMFVNTAYLRHKLYAVITVGFAIASFAALLWEGSAVFGRLSLQGWFVVGATLIFGLWLIHKVLLKTNRELIRTSYANAVDTWAIALCSAELLSLTWHCALVYLQLATPEFLYLIASAITLAAISMRSHATGVYALRSWQKPTNLAFYGIGWCLELLTAELVSFSERSLVCIAIANIGLGLSVQLLGDWWQRRHGFAKLPGSFHILPLIYGGLSLLLQLQSFTPWTSLGGLGVAVIAVGVGRRRQEFKFLVYLGITGISLFSELLLAQLLQSSQQAWGDRLIAMSALGASIMYGYRIFSPWLNSYLRLSTNELKAVTHLHWAGSSLLLIAATAAAIATNRLVGLGTSVFLIRYAIFQGRDVNSKNSQIAKEIWVYLGLFELAATGVYWRATPAGQLFAPVLAPWNGAIACAIAYFFYTLPWESWGWSKRPWQRTAHILPLIVLWQTRLLVSPVSLLVTAAFYLFLAKVSNRFRLTYISVALIDWAIFRYFEKLGFTATLWYVSAIGLSLLYIPQFDPQLKLPAMKTHRHYWRLLSSGLICGYAILFHQDTALIPAIFSLIAIFAGLSLRVRAFLYVGTISFVLTTFYQLVVTSLDYPFFKWIVGLVTGIVLISIAASFEMHRSRLISLLSNLNEQMQQWE